MQRDDESESLDFSWDMQMARRKRMLFRLVLFALAGLTFVALAGLLWLGIDAFHLAVGWNVGSDAASLSVPVADFDEAAFVSTHEIERVNVTSSLDGHDIPCDVILADGQGGADFVILAHGAGGTRRSTYPVAEMFLQHGWNVLAYDQRASGENTAQWMTYGYLERYDLWDCADYARARMGETGRLGAWGISAGASAVAMAAGGARSSLDFLILDSPLSGMADALYAALYRQESWIPVGVRVSMGNLVLKLRLGFGYQEASVSAYVSGIRVPVLILNSYDDEYAPYYVGQDIFNQMPEEKKEIHTFSGAAHGALYAAHPQEYWVVIEDFLDRVA